MSQFVTIVRRRIAENQPGQTDPLDPATGPFFRDPPEIAELERFDQLYYEPNEPQNYVFTNYRTAITYSKQLANRLGFELRIKTTGVNMREGTVCKVCFVMGRLLLGLLPLIVEQHDSRSTSYSMSAANDKAWPSTAGSQKRVCVSANEIVCAAIANGTVN